MIYNCDENEKNIHKNISRLIQIHCYDFTHWDSQQWWLIHYFVMVAFFTMQTTTIMSL